MSSQGYFEYAAQAPEDRRVRGRADLKQLGNGLSPKQLARLSTLEGVPKTACVEGLAIVLALLAMPVWLAGMANNVAARSPQTYRPPRRWVSLGPPAIALVANLAVAAAAYAANNMDMGLVALAGMALAIGARIGFLVRPRKQGPTR
jgi:hypothetical protein